MKYSFAQKTLVVFALAGVLFLQTRGAWSLELAPIGMKGAALEEVSASDKSPTVATKVVDTAPPRADIPMTDTSNHNTVVSIKEIVSALDHPFSEQESDVEWSRTAEVQVRTLFQPLTGNDTTLISVQCRTTLCRAEFLHTTDEAFHNFLDTLKTKVMVGWKGQSVGGRVETNDAGQVRSVFYLAKQGSNLPLRSLAHGASGDGQNPTKSSKVHPVP